MVYSEHKLQSTNIDDLDTEIRFAVASVKADGCRLLRLYFERRELDKDNRKMSASIKKILRVMIQGSLIHFYLNKKGSERSTTEYEFLMNKYPEYVSFDNEDEIIFYISM